jgi:hypothetical protein
MSLDLRILYGIVIACSPATNLTYLISADVLLRDICGKLGLAEHALNSLHCPHDPSHLCNKLLHLPAQGCGYTTMLTEQAMLFARVQLGNYAECARHALEFPGLSSQREVSFTLHAEFAFATGDEDCAKRCIQQVTFLKCLDATYRHRISRAEFLNMARIDEHVVTTFLVAMSKLVWEKFLYYCASDTTSNMAPDFVTALVNGTDHLWVDLRKSWPDCHETTVHYLSHPIRVRDTRGWKVYKALHALIHDRETKPIQSRRGVI